MNSHASTMRARVFKSFEDMLSFPITKVFLPCRVFLNQWLTIFRVILRIVFRHVSPFLFGVGVRHESILAFLLSKAMSSRPTFKNEHEKANRYQCHTNFLRPSRQKVCAKNADTDHYERNRSFRHRFTLSFRLSNSDHI